MAPTQLLGVRLFTRTRAEALLTYSAKDPTARTLVVFPTKLGPESSLELVDPATGQVVQRLGPDGRLTPGP